MRAVLIECLALFRFSNIPLFLLPPKVPWVLALPQSDWMPLDSCSKQAFPNKECGARLPKSDEEQPHRGLPLGLPSPSRLIAGGRTK